MRGTCRGAIWEDDHRHCELGGALSSFTLVAVSLDKTWGIDAGCKSSVVVGLL